MPRGVSKEFVPTLPDGTELLSAEQMIEESEKAHLDRILSNDKHTEEVLSSLLSLATGVVRELHADEEGYFQLVLDDDGNAVLIEDIKGSTRVQAGKVWLERAHGRPPQNAQHTGHQPGTVFNVYIKEWGTGQMREVPIEFSTPDRDMIEAGSEEHSSSE